MWKVYETQYPFFFFSRQKKRYWIKILEPLLISTAGSSYPKPYYLIKFTKSWMKRKSWVVNETYFLRAKKLRHKNSFILELSENFSGTFGGLVILCLITFFPLDFFVTLQCKNLPKVGGNGKYKYFSGGSRISQWEHQLPGWCTNLLFCTIFAKNHIKRDLFGSTNVFAFQIEICKFIKNALISNFLREPGNSQSIYGNYR